MNLFSLQNHSALITGSTYGIGAAIADTMEAAGAEVIRHGRHPAPVENKTSIATDLLDPDGPERLLNEAFASAHPPDLLVCNAGSFFDTAFLDMDADRWDKTIRLNLQAPYFLVQGFAKRLAKSGKSGAVVILGSTNGAQAEEDSTAYDISKGGVVMMTRTLATALAPLGIRVNSIAPGLIRTPLTENWMTTRPDLIAHYENKILLRRIGTATECAGAAVFLCSDAASYITGHTLIIDGGLTVGQIGRLP